MTFMRWLLVATVLALVAPLWLLGLVALALIVGGGKR